MNSYYESVRESIGYVEFQNSPTRCEPHWHQAVEILCALDDEVYTLVNSKEKILQPGEICVADCYDVHSFYSSERPVMIIIIPSEFLNDYIKMKGKKTSRYALYHRSGNLSQNLFVHARIPVAGTAAHITARLRERDFRPDTRILRFGRICRRGREPDEKYP